MTAARMLALTALLACGVAQAQTSPTRPMRFMTGSVSSNGDAVSRLLGQVLSASLGQPVLIENRPGGISALTVARAAPDGQTLLVTGASFWLAHLVQDNAQWDPIRDFEPVCLLTSSPNLVVVHPSLPARSIKELIALAKSRPGQLNFGAGSIGSTPHLGGELFNAMAQVNIVAIPYKGISTGMNDLLGGQVEVMFPNASAVSTHLKSGRVRGLAVGSARPTPLFPNLPTVSASGLAGYESVLLNGMFAPGRTPPAVIARLHQELAAALQRPDIKEKFFNMGMESVGDKPEQLMTEVKREIAVWGKLIRERGIRK